MSTNVYVICIDSVNIDSIECNSKILMPSVNSVDIYSI